MRILIIEPFFGGSHKKWVEGLQKHSRHEVGVLGLEAKRWKWRMHGGAISLSQDFLNSSENPDVIVASDMLDLTTFQSLTRNLTSDIPMGIYFHENQLSYPKSPRDSDVKKGRDLHYGFINIASARAADSIFFNSQFHLHNFLGEAAKFLEKFNDHSLKDCVSIIAEKASVIPVGLDLNLQARDFSQIFKKNKPVILWNHRWEYDKNPKLFFNTLYKLQERSVDFDLIVLGEDYSPPPTHFAEAKERLSQHIIHWGYAESQEKYISLLQSADILPVTSIQEFFGISVCEAIFHGCFPILPRRLSYRELIPQQHHKAVFYDSDEQLELKIEESIANPPSQKCIEELSNFILEFSWENIIERYDCAFEALKNLRT